MMDRFTPVVSILQSYRAAVLAKDVQAFCALYHRDVLIFDSWDHWCCRGLDDWRRMAVGWFGSLGDDRVDIEFTDLQVHAGQDVAAGSALVIYTAIDPAGERLRSLTERISLVLRQDSEGWRIVHQHTSVPVGFESRQPVPRTA